MIGGVKITSVNCAQAVDYVFALATSRAGGFVTVTGAHGIVEAQTDPELKMILNRAAMAVPDGMPVAWIGRAQGFPVSRVAGAELFSAIVQDGRAQNLRHYFYGASPQILETLISKVGQLVDPQAIVGFHAPPIRPPRALEDASIIAAMRDAAPDLIWVGLSTPKQEYWMVNHEQFFPNALLIGVGAAFDFAAGTAKRAPRIVQRMGMEWLYRLMREPARLWPRYRRVIPGMLWLIARDRWTGKSRVE